MGPVRVQFRKLETSGADAYSGINRRKLITRSRQWPRRGCASGLTFDQADVWASCVHVTRVCLLVLAQGETSSVKFWKSIHNWNRQNPFSPGTRPNIYVYLSTHCNSLATILEVVVITQVSLSQTPRSPRHVIDIYWSEGMEVLVACATGIDLICPHNLQLLHVVAAHSRFRTCHL